MTIRQNAFVATTAAVLVFALAPHALAAVDGEAVVEALSAQMKRQGLELTSESVETRGDDVAIRNLKITVPDGNDGFQMENVLLENVAEVGNGSYVIGRIAMPSFTQTSEGWTVGFEGGEIQGYYLAGPNEVDPVVNAGIYRAMEIGALEVATNGATVFKLDGITSSMSAYEPGATMDIEGTIKDFFIDFSKMPDPKAQATMAEIGYSQMSGRMTGTGTWNTDNGDLSFEEKLTLDDAAGLNIDISIGGYTPQLIAALQEMQKNMEGQSDEAMGFAMLGLMQQLEIDKISIEVVDDSATNRLLDYRRQEAGHEPRRRHRPGQGHTAVCAGAAAKSGIRGQGVGRS